MLLLRYRPRSVAEARQRLSEQGFEPDVVDATIRQAVASEQLDDAAFTKLWVRDRMWHHPLSRAAVARELHQKGIRQDLIDSTLAAEYPAVREVELATELAEKRAAKLRDVDSDTRRNRLTAFLSRRGFAPALSSRIIASIEKEMLDDGS